MSDSLMTEVARQKKYLAELPPNFKYPLFNTKPALESQPQNGYRQESSDSRHLCATHGCRHARPRNVAHRNVDRSTACNL